MSQSYVIIGDGVAGSSAAETLREEEPDADITVVTDEGEALYNRILIKEFAKGKLPEAPISIHDGSWYADRDINLELDTLVVDVDVDAPPLETHPGPRHPMGKGWWYADRDINRELDTLVVDVDVDAHTIETHDGTVHEWDKLLIAAGGTPTQLPVENSDAEGVHHFWTFEDARSIKSHIEAADSSVVVGAGLLGIDLAAITAAQDVEGKYLMRGNCWWRYALSEQGAEIIHDALRERNVEPVFQSGVDHFEVDDDGRVTTAVDPNGDEYDADFVGIAIGLDFNTEILQDTPIETDDGIVVDEYMRTNHDDVFAAGDITEFHDLLLGERGQNGAWGSAKEQGSIAARNMVDYGAEPFEWVSSYSITHFDFPFLSFGHPTLGDDEAEAKYSDTEWRRLAFKDGRIVGGVLIGDLSPQTKYKQLMREQRRVADQKDVLMQQTFELEDLDAPETPAE